MNAVLESCINNGIKINNSEEQNFNILKTLHIHYKVE